MPIQPLLSKAHNDALAVAVSTAIDNIVSQTKFNSKAILATGGTTFAIGVTDGSDTTTITSYGVAAATVTAAQGAETEADLALGDAANGLGNVAAAMQALKARQAVAYSASATLLAAASRLEETDFAVSSANLTKFAILNQSAMAMVAQANQAQSAILAVLQ